MNLRELQTLFDYHCWARDRVLDAAEQLTPEQFTRDLIAFYRERTATSPQL